MMPSEPKIGVLGCASGFFGAGVACASVNMILVSAFIALLPLRETDWVLNYAAATRDLPDTAIRCKGK
jgi:hypothetical protein